MDERPLDTLKRLNMTPLEPYPGSVIKPWRMICGRCKSEITPNLNNLRKSVTGCIVCRGHRKWDDQSAKSLLKENDLVALQEYPKNTNKRWSVKCLKCGRQGSIQLSSLLKGQGGCRFCGANHDNKNLLYLVHNVQINMLKVGISSGWGYRIETHKAHGWHVDGVYLFEDPMHTSEVETKIIHYLRVDLQSEMASRGSLPQHGYSETGNIMHLKEIRQFLEINLKTLKHKEITEQFLGSKKCQWCKN